MNGLGTWMNVIEWLNKATIMFNCLFLFWFRRHFAERINEQFNFLQFAFPPTSDNNYRDRLDKFLEINNIKKAFEDLKIDESEVL